MAQHYSTGPAFIYVGLGPANAPLFLGTTEKTPQIQNRPAFKEVFSDSHGQIIPSDMSYQGQDAIVTARFTRFNMSTLLLLQEYISFTGVLGVQGMDVAGARGALMLLEDQSYRLWIRYPFASKAVMNTAANGAMPVGRRYLNTYLTNDNLDEIGTNPWAMSLVWHCLSTYTPNFQGGFHSLYDTNMDGLPVPT